MLDESLSSFSLDIVGMVAEYAGYTSATPDGKTQQLFSFGSDSLPPYIKTISTDPSTGDIWLNVDNKLAVFDYDGSYKFTLPSFSTRYRCYETRHVAFAGGRAFIGSTLHPTVHICSPDGTLRQHFTVPRSWFDFISFMEIGPYPADVHLAALRDRIFITRELMVYEFDLNCKLMNSWSTRYSMNTRNRPEDFRLDREVPIAVNETAVYAVDKYRHKVQALSHSGRFLHEFGPQLPMEIDRMLSVSLDTAGNVFVCLNEAETFSGLVQVFSPEGELITGFRNDNPDDGLWSCLRADSNNRILVGSTCRVDVYSFV